MRRILLAGGGTKSVTYRDKKYEAWTQVAFTPMSSRVASRRVRRYSLQAVPRVHDVEERPEGLVYRPEFVSEEEEREILGVLEGLDFREVKMRGQTARRTVAHFGYDYDYESWALAPAEPLPTALSWLRDRAAEFAEVAPEDLAEVLISRYPPGATIGWHRDAPMFGPKIVGVSLGSTCRMRFERRAGDVRRVYALELAPRSVYLLAGKARSAWRHSIPATKSLRYSITFRTVRESAQRKL